MIVEVGVVSSKRGQSKSSEDVLDYVHYMWDRLLEEGRVDYSHTIPSKKSGCCQRRADAASALL